MAQSKTATYQQSKYLNRMPWADEDGWFNGDMFYDWLRSVPQESDYPTVYEYTYAVKVWKFLNHWETSIIDQTREAMADEVRARVFSANSKPNTPRRGGTHDTK